MIYRISHTDSVFDAINAQMAYFASEGVPEEYIDRWVDGLITFADSLCEWPRRFPIAAVVSATMGYEVRRALYGGHALYYRVDDARQLVETLELRHTSRQPWMEEEE